MSDIAEEIKSVNTEKLLSIVFIIVGVTNIIGDNILIDALKTNDECLRARANTIFLWGLIISFIIYVVIVARNYNFYRQKKEAGLDASLEQRRLFGSVLILFGFALIFNYFIETGFRTNNPPVL